MGLQDTTPPIYAIEFPPDDVCITTRAHEDHLISAVSVHGRTRPREPEIRRNLKARHWCAAFPPGRTVSRGPLGVYGGAAAFFGTFLPITQAYFCDSCGIHFTHFTGH